MKIRTQLLLACFVLAVLPLTGIVVYSYQTSRRALENAYHAEARRLAAQMDRRLASIQADLDQRLAALSALPLDPVQTASVKSAGDPARNVAMASIQAVLGEVAPLIKTLQLVPAPTPPNRPQEAAAPEAAESNVTVEASAVDPPSAPPAAPAVAAAGAAGDGEAPEPIVVDVPHIPPANLGLPPDFAQRVGEIVALTRDMSRPGITAEERQALHESLAERQRALDAAMKNAQRDFQAPFRAAAKAEREAAARERQHRIDRRIHAQVPNFTFDEPRPKRMRYLNADERRKLAEKEKQAALLFGNRFDVPLQSAGTVVGHIQPQLNTAEIVKRVLGGASDEAGEIPFAVDREGTVYTRNSTDRATLDALGIPARLRQKQPIDGLRNWVVAMSARRDNGLRLGVVRPVGENLEELRHTAAQNFGWGLGVIAFALLGMLPIADHFTRDIKLVTDGAERVAHGDLQTRVPVRSRRNEFGQLAMAFNRMAEDLSVNQQRLVEQERARQKQEMQQRLLELEYERKSDDLEEARRFQLSMLPKHVPQHERYDVAVLTQPAAEVGGDYYDFHEAEDGVLSVTIGDATGHGAKAGTMVTVIKTLFAGYDGRETPAAFLGSAAEKIKRMELGRMAMALSLARFEEGRLTVAAAGMPPLLIHRAAQGRVEEVTLPATPLGTLGVQYDQTDVALAPGDTVLLMTDGLPELLNEAGQQLGYPQTAEEFASAATAATVDEVLGQLAAVARRWHGDQPPNDDITFVAVRVRARA